MRIKTIIIFVIAILFTIVFMQNTGTVPFTILFGTFYMSKLTMLLLVSIIAFILGWLVGRPKSIKKLGGGLTDINPGNNKTGTLSDEDKDYIN